MATQKIKRVTQTTRYIRNSQTTTDRQGKKHCKTCGAYIGNRSK